ncbi:predicted hydrolase (HAD superfamily) [Candidatus Moduliflexus flocculans]|uniref:Predicted hydrolase (HAD superfamily) n=1 Tax=Candidatus Moduliflexus flocculans TaxID=1499966 RepID=A0A0S6VXD1_9BACT|nr:predicted hydrolase (HAD superfamily) [Candidatus Moduliflexus flocculans]
MTDTLTGIRAVFWDNDGVLVDTEPLYYQATRDTMATVGIELTEEQYYQFFLVENCGAFHLARDKGFSESVIDELRDARNAKYNDLLKTSPVAIAGVEQVLQRMKGKFVMGIVTSSHREHFDTTHQHTTLTQYVDFILTSEDYSVTKPDPAPYLAAIQRSGCRPEECLVVEDSERGLIAATRAGLKCVVIPRNLTRRGDFRAAYRVLNDISEVSELLA